MPRTFPAALVNLELRPASRVPLYQQLFGKLRAMILSGELAGGTRLPATRQLVKTLGCSRSTVLLVFEMLAAEGYVESRQGSGTYISVTLPEEAITCAPAPVGDKAVAPPRLSRMAMALVGTPVPSSLLPHSRVIFPDIREFPFELWSRLYRTVLPQALPERDADWSVFGFRPLRRAIATYLRDVRGVLCTEEQIAITSGTSHALTLLFQLLLDPGDDVWIEDPSPPWVQAKAVVCGATPVFVPTDREGFDVAEARRRAPAARVALVTPSHQCPSGAVMSPRRRAALLEWAELADGWIVEDDYDSEFRYTGRPLPTLHALDTNSRVFYVASFSKVLLPQLRLGYVVLPPQFIDTFARLRALIDRYTSATLQPVLAQFIEDGHLASHLRRMRTLYEARQDALLDASAALLDGLLRFEPSEAGIHSVGAVASASSDRLDAATIASLSSAAGVAMSPMALYCHDRPAPAQLLFGYAQHRELEIKFGIERLARLIAAARRGSRGDSQESRLIAV